MMRPFPGLRSVLLLILLGCAVPAGAQTCTINAADVAFGGIDPLAGFAVDVNSSIELNCTTPPLQFDPTVGVCIYIDEGSGGSDGTANRYMLQGADTLPFNLYKDSARTQIWGSETAFPAAGAQRVVVPINVGVLGGGSGSLTVPVYGRVPAAISNRPVGTYTSDFVNGARIRSSFTDTVACDGVSGTNPNSDTFTANGSILATCAVESDDLDFGAHGQVDAAVDAASQIRTSCSTGLVYSIAVGPGSGGGFSTRRMSHLGFPTEQVSYQLFTDAARTQIWGDGSNGTVTVAGSGDGSPLAATVYGRVPLQSTPRPGDYQDSVVVTVSY